MMRWLVRYCVCLSGALALAGCPAEGVDLGDASAPGDAGDVSSGGDDPAFPDGIFETIDDERWDDTAVRQVLHVFAFGSLATDAQIVTWAGMEPEAAILEMLTLDEHNPRLAPGAATADGTLRGLADLWASDDGSNPVPSSRRGEYRVGAWGSPGRTWFTAVSGVGPNPVRQRIGLLETNYHLAVNQEVGVNNWQIFSYYDEIMEGLEAGLPYEQVLAVAAKSAAVATQYGHSANLFIDARFEGNEDFAREFHQLFFGILGVDDPEHHEFTTIRNTAKMLTHMLVDWIEDGEDSRLSDEVTFGVDYHYPSSLEILGVDIEGATAADKIDAAVEVAIAHPESLANLPLIIIRNLADDHLDETEAAAIQGAWDALAPKELLPFLQAYAVSTTFHSPTRVKHWSSIERHVKASHLIALTREAAIAGYYDARWPAWQEGARVFRPTRNVFGNQTGLDAAGSAMVFRSAYNLSSDSNWFYSRTGEEEDGWLKDWGAVVPAAADGTWRVKEVSEWLWQRFIADGLDNFGPLERAHVYALVGSSKDLGLFVDENDPTATITGEDLETKASLGELVSDMEIATVALGSDDPEKRQTANRRIGLALCFILSTPYAFVQEGR